MKAKLVERISEFRVRKMAKRAVPAAILSLFILLLMVYMVLAYSVGQNEVWDPDAAVTDWVTGFAQGYVEGQGVTYAVEFKNMDSGETGPLYICLDYNIGGAYGFTELVDVDSPLINPIPDCTAFGTCTDPWGSDITSNDQLVWGSNIDVTGVVYEGIGTGGSDCSTTSLKYRVDFITAAGDGKLYYAGLLAQPGAPLPTGGFVPAGQGASSSTQNIDANLKGAGSKVVHLDPGSIAAATYDRAVSKSCPADFVYPTTAPPPPFIFTVFVTNNGPSPVPIADTMLTDTFNPADLIYTGPATFAYNDPNNTTSYTPGSGSCTIPSPGTGSFTCTATTPDFLAVGQTLKVELGFDLTFPGEPPRTISNTASVASNTSDTNSSNDSGSCGATTPVTVATFKAQAVGDTTRFDWQTDSEIGNLGFNIYVESENDRQLLNEDLIPSHVVDSNASQDYFYEANGFSGDVFYIEDVDYRGQTRLHGPFELGVSYGEKVNPDPIDWMAIRTEHDSKEARREAQAVEMVAVSLGQDAAGVSLDINLDQQALSSNGLSHILLPVVGAVQGGSPQPPQPGFRINFNVAENGLYRVTYEDLKAAGFDLLLQNPDQLALLNQGQPVPMRVEAQWAIGPDDFIEFYGQGLDTFYTDKNIYTLVFDPTKALRVIDDGTAPSNAAPAAHYMETVTIENENAFSQLSPVGDPWFDTRFLVFTTPQSWTVDIDIDHYVSNVAPSTLQVGMWGSSEWWSWFTGNNHHVQVSVNNSVPIKDMYFKGVVDASFKQELADGLLQEGVNKLTFRLPGDTGVPVEHVALDSYGISYPREYVARDGMLAFEAAGEVFRVEGLPSSAVLVYRMSNNQVTRLTDVQVSGSAGNYSITFAGLTEAAKYVVVAVPALKAPGIEAGRPYSDITSGTADYIMITHPDFKAGLDELVKAREAEGYTVKVVDVEDIYAQFSYEIFDARAIKDYVTYAKKNMGTSYFLLVGGDTIDYRGYLATGGISFIPSLYTAVTDGSRFAPADPLYADVNDDGIPDVAIGRFIARDSAELKLLIDKTLAYKQKDYGKKAVFAADVNFGSDSDGFIAQLPAGWDVTKVYLDDITDEAVAKQLLLAAINAKTALTSYVGHSGSQHWSSGLLTTTDVEGLTNVNAPTVVTQWGCYNTYYVSPAYDTMAHKFLLSGDAGAAAVMGATALTLASSEQTLGEHMMPRLAAPGMTLGQAMLEAKQQAAAGSGDQLKDVLYGWTLLGDPTLVIDP